MHLCTYALMQGHFDIACELLTRYQAAARISSGLDGTPLQTMSSPFIINKTSEDYKKVIKLLTKHEAEINEATPFPRSENDELSSESRTPLQLVINHVNVDYIKTLIDCNANSKAIKPGEPNLLNLAAAVFMKPIDSSKAIGILNILKSHFEPCDWRKKNADQMSAMDYILKHLDSENILKQLKLTKQGEPEADTPADAMDI